jgi:glycosyltransferase involved in cell wall biosynthesis
LGRELSLKGHEVYIIASNVHYATRSRLEGHSGLESVDLLSFLWLDTPPYHGNSIDRLWNNLVFTYSLLNSRRIHSLPQPDVIIGSSPHPLAAWAAERLAKRYRVPFVMEVRDLWPRSLVDLGQFSPHHPFVLMLSCLERYLYAKAVKIIVLAPRAVDYIASLGTPTEKVIWLPNGIDLSLAPNPNPPQEKPYLTVMYAGSFTKTSGLDVLLEAAFILQQEVLSRQVKFRLIGDGPDKGRLMSKAKEMRINNVVFEDAVPKRQVYNWLQEADAFVVIVIKSPLYKWGLSFNKLYDYLAMARPIIFAADIPDNPVEESCAGITVPPDDPQALAKAVQKLGVMPSAKHWDMGLRGRRYVEEHHDFARLADKLDQVLYQVVEAKNTVPAPAPPSISNARSRC